MKSKSKNNKDKTQATAQYLLAEFEMLHQRANLQEQIIANKVNFYLLLVSALAGGSILAIDIDSLENHILLLAFILVLILFIVGITTFLQILDYVISSTFFYRRAGRIRKWFLDFNPQIKDYSPFRATDNRPHYYTDRAMLRGLDPILLVLNSATAATLGILLFWIIYEYRKAFSPFINNWIPIAITILLGVLLSFFAWNIQVNYAKETCKRKEKFELKKGRVHFHLDSDTEVGVSSTAGQES